MQPSTVSAPTPTSLQFSYTAAATMTAGVVTVQVPTGWTPPTTSNTTASTGTVATTDTTITVSDVTLNSGGTFMITYGTPTSLVTPPGAAGFDTFAVAMSPTSSGTPAPISSSPSLYVYVLATPTLLGQVSTVPASVFNAVGIHAPAEAILETPTIALHQRPFVTKLHGATVPRSFFLGAEWCPYCDPASWGIVVALSRFGHFNQLYEITSSPTDVYPNTPGFTFNRATFTSPYLTFTGFEQQGPTGGQTLETPPRAILALANKYDPQGSWPFMDVGNFAFVQESPFEPSVLTGLTPSEIGASLTATKNDVTKSIIAWANYLSAGICATDHERPTPVCDSPGVLQADGALKLPKN